MTTSLAAPAPSARRERGAQPLAGTGTMIRFMLRRDRVRLPAWLIAITGFTVLSANSLPDFYLTEADRQARAELLTNPGTAAVSGPGFGLDDYHFGAMLSNEVLSWVALATALMAILLMVRHTRAEEETGRAEFIRAGVLGRHATLTAATVVVGGASVLLGLLFGLGLGGLGLDGVTWAGSWLFGAAVASIGLAFTAATALTAQVSQHARGAAGLAGAALGVAFLLRAAGDMSYLAGGSPALSWLSPIGWAQQTQPYVGNRWWPLLPAVGLVAVLLAVAYWLSTRRDVGAGMLPTRPGPPVGSPRLASPLGLAWRQHRAAVYWWALAITAFALGYGSLVSEVESFGTENETVMEWIAATGTDVIIDGFLSIIVMLWATAVTVFAALTVLRLRTEETAGRAEPLLATAVSRVRWVGSHLTIAVVGSAVLLLLSGLGLGLTASAALGDGELVGRLAVAALAYLPAIWVIIGLAVALFGLVPRAALLVWLVIAYSGLMVSLAGLLGLPDWTTNLSPLGHVPMLPAAELSWPPLLILTVLAAGLMALGLYGFRRRDLETK